MKVGCARPGKSMARLNSSRKLCPLCGKAVTPIPDDGPGGRQRYICLACEERCTTSPSVMGG